MMELIYDLLSTKTQVHNRQRRRSLAFPLTSFGMIALESRELPSLPIFALAPNQPQPTATSTAFAGVDDRRPGSTGPVTQSDTGTGTAGPAAQVSVFGYPIYVGGYQSGGYYILYNADWVRPSAKVEAIVDLPNFGSNTGNSAIQIGARHQQSHEVQTDIYGAFLEGNDTLDTRVFNSTPGGGNINMTLQDAGTGAPPGGTVTIHFDATLDTLDSGGGSGSRQTRHVALQIVTNYVTIEVMGADIVVQDNTGRMVSSSVGFVSDHGYFVYEGVFPALPNLALNYADTLSTSVTGTFGGNGSAEHAFVNTAFAWNFNVAANG